MENVSSFMHGELADCKKENYDLSHPRRPRGDYRGGENSKRMSKKIREKKSLSFFTFLRSNFFSRSFRPCPFPTKLSLVLRRWIGPLSMPTQHIATLLGATSCVRLAPCCELLRMLGVVGSSLNGQIWANISQQGAKRTLHDAPNNVGICCVGMLRSLRPGLKVVRMINSLFSDKNLLSFMFGISFHER